MAGSPSYAARWAFTTVGGSLSSAPTFDFSGDTLQKTQGVLYSQGLRGIRARQVVASRAAPYTVAGTLTCQPSPQHLSYFLQWAMGGGTAAAPVFANALALRDILVDRTGDVYKYSGMAINRLTLSGRAGQLCEMSVDLVGKTETGGQSWSGPAALGSDLSWQPLQHADLDIEFFSEATAVEDFTLTIDNQVTAKHRNELAPQDIIPGPPGRIVRLSSSAVFSSAEEGIIYDGPDPDTSMVLTLTNGNVSAGFTFSNARYTRRTALPNGDEFMLAVEADVYGTAAGAEMTVAIDLNP